MGWSSSSTTRFQLRLAKPEAIYDYDFTYEVAIVSAL